MPLAGFPFHAAPPWYLYHWRPLVAVMAFLVAVMAFLGLLIGFALAATTTIPPASRPDAICQALGAEAPCETEEIAHLRGTVTMIARDTATDELVGLLTAKRHAVAAAMGAGDEAALLIAAQVPQSTWVYLVPGSVTWPTLRTLAGVGEGIPVVMAAQQRPGGWDGTGDGMATTALVRVRISMLVLRQ